MFLLSLTFANLGLLESAPLLFEDDIVWDSFVKKAYTPLSEREKKDVADTGVYPKWDQRLVKDGSITVILPFVSNLDRYPAVFLKLAMRTWTERTCIKFIRKTDETDFIKFVKGERCSSYIGRVGGGQEVTLGPSCTAATGRILHELGHVLGLFHEQSRCDRDSFVEIITSNIQPGSRHNFQKMSLRPVYTTPDNYDYQSIMHYPKHAFSRDPTRLATIRTLQPAYQNIIGQRLFLTEFDVQKINKLYQCDCRHFNTTSTRKRKYWGDCNFLWLFTYPCKITEILTEWCISKQCFNLAGGEAGQQEKKFRTEQEVKEWRSDELCYEQD